MKLSFKQPQRALGDSFVQAKRLFLSVERRLTANPQLHEKYKAFTKEFMDLYHLKEISADEAINHLRKLITCLTTVYSKKNQQQRSSEWSLTDMRKPAMDNL